ncbi:MAG: HlyD family secretion protein [Mangrovibacterium sp.]
MKKLSIAIAMTALCSACGSSDFDASGYFEADEVMVSAQQNGVLLQYDVVEGMALTPGQRVGQIDVALLQLQKEQTEASLASLDEKIYNPETQAELVRRQITVQELQLKQLNRELLRTEKLLDSEAATIKQHDDLKASIVQLASQIEVTKQQLKLNTYNSNAQNRSILSEKAALEKAVARIQEEINRATISNPIDGTVLVNYALAGEMQTIGKPLYKIADVSTLELRAYLTGAQLASIKLGDEVSVRIDSAEKDYKYYTGEVSWISAKAEFSPKNIPTKDERANLVYAFKVRVKNDGRLKIGMYGEVELAPSN